MNFLLTGNPIIREAAIFAILVGVPLIGAIVVLVLRTRSLPSCWNCGFSGVHRTRSSGRLLDTFARLCFLHPYRCQRCLRRSYCLGGSPNILLRRGLWKQSLEEGTVVIVEGYRAKNGENRANGSNITFTDGKRLFLGGSNPNEQPQ